MRGPRKANAENWEIDGKTITVRIPMPFARRGGRKVIVAPDGGDAWAPTKPRPHETLIRALARGHRWKRMLEERRYQSAAEIAEAEGVTRSFANRLLRRGRRGIRNACHLRLLCTAIYLNHALALAG